MEKFIDYAKSLDLNVGAISNGILIRKKLLSIKKLDEFNITLDAYDYLSFARNRGGTEKQWNSIVAAHPVRENNIRFSISFLATSENIDDLFQLIELADELHPTTL